MQPQLSVCLFLASSLFAANTSAQPTLYTIEGADPLLERNIRSHVTIPSLDCGSSLRRLARSTARVDAQIVRAGRALGYYKLRSAVRFDTGDDCWSMHITVEPGDYVTVAAINIQITADQRFFESIEENLPIRLGEQLNQASYERIKTNLSAQAVDVGFFDARFEKSQLLLDLQEDTATVDIAFNPGPRSRFGSVEIERI